MLHSKSKSNQIQQKEDSIKNKEEKENPNSINEYISTTANQINSTNDNFDINLSNEDNIGKLSSLFNDQDNDDKIVNISKLEQSLCYNIKNSNRDKYDQQNQQSNNNIKLSTKNIKDDDPNSDIIINISNLDYEINEQEINNGENLDKINSNINSNMNIIKNNTNKIIEKKDEIFLIKKRSKNIIKKLIILIVILLFFIFSLIIIFLVYLYSKEFSFLLYILYISIIIYFL